MTRILFGLGNPGQRYAATRHNAGWLTLERLAKAEGQELRPSRFVDGEEATVRLGGETVRLVRPTTFRTSMTMTRAFKDVWLPRDVEIQAGALFATGPIDVRYRIEYRDYREAITDARIKRR